ncbi:MAG TPA: hypothetical protein PLJ21_11850 [Pseudobdellovibrionaceae bacterium]|nr:hypothetical protein [Pseudobdellovibrionaceae bacterium]
MSQFKKTVLIIFVLFGVVFLNSCNSKKEAETESNFSGYWKPVGSFNVNLKTFESITPKKYPEIHFLYIDKKGVVNIEKSHVSTTTTQSLIQSLKAGDLKIQTQFKGQLQFIDNLLEASTNTSTNLNSVAQSNPIFTFEVSEKDPNQLIISKIIKKEAVEEETPWIKLVRRDAPSVESEKEKYLQFYFQKNQKLNRVFDLIYRKNLLLTSKTDSYHDEKGKLVEIKLPANDVKEIEGTLGSERLNIKYLQIQNQQQATVNIQTQTLMDFRILENNQLEILFFDKTTLSLLFSGIVETFDSPEPLQITTHRNWVSEGKINVKSVFQYKILKN